MRDFPDLVAIVIDRRDVEAYDPEPTLAVLRNLMRSPQTIPRLRESVVVAFDGYDHTAEELWEIGPVRECVQALDVEFPCWLYFLTRNGPGLNCVARCFLLPFLTEAGRRRHHGPALAHLLETRWLPAMNQMASAGGWVEVDIMDLTNSALQYLLHGSEGAEPSSASTH